MLFVSISTQSCVQKYEPNRNEVIKTGYPEIADEIIERDFDGLWQLKDHHNVHVRALVWKAIGKSKPDDLDSFINYTIQQDDSLAWYALSLQPLASSAVDSIGYLFSEDTIQSQTVCELFFKRGTANVLQILINRPEMLKKSEVCAKAVGGILARVRVDEFKQREVFAIALESSDLRIWRNLLYGFYRSPINRPEPGSILKNDLLSMLQNYGPYFSSEMDEYIVRILGKEGFLDVLDRRSDRYLVNQIQLSVELAKGITFFESDELNHPYIKRLIRHPVDNVVIQVLQSLGEFDAVPKDIIQIVQKEIAPITRDPEVFVESLRLLVKNRVHIEGYRTKLEFMGSMNELVKHQVLSLMSEFLSTDEYLDRIASEVRNGGIGGLRALQSLSVFYTDHIEETGIHEKVRNITFLALEKGDANVFSSLTLFLVNSNLVTPDDYDQLYHYYETFVDSGQWAKADVMEKVLSSRFADQFEPLNTPEPTFHIPNWERLYQMGDHPFWVLETEKGTIEIRLDPLEAPFTVSSIDSLTRSGAYENVPFHRVVRNFVAQGGDVSLKADSDVRIDYTLPTEPSYHSFERGKLGIASEGQDTEGSQYFIMLNWSPHLDGNYTIFGEVTKGMDVVDRIQIGDEVLNAEIYWR